MKRCKWFTVLGAMLPVLWMVACGGAQKTKTKTKTKTIAKRDKTAALRTTPAPIAQTGAVRPGSEADKLRRRCKDSLAAARKARADLIAATKAGEGAGAVRGVGLAAYNRMTMALTNAESEASLWRSVHPDEAMRKEAEKCEQQASALGTELTLDRELYGAFAKLSTDGATPLEKRLIAKTLRDFKRAGVDKDEVTRKHLEELNKAIVKAGQAFTRAIIEDKRSIRVDPAALKGLPEDWIKAHPPGKDGKSAVTTDYPDYIPFMTYSESDAARKRLYTVYRQRGTPANTANLRRIIELRHEVAKTLGYPNWAAFITEDKMIRTDKAAREFIDKIRTIADKRMKSEYKLLLRELRRTDPGAKVVSDWQKTFLLNRLKKRRFAFDAQKLRPYLHYDKVKKGLLGLTSLLFGVTYKERKDIPTWHRDVEVYDVLEGSKLLGRIFLDMHPRKDKYKHAAQFTLTNGLAGVQIPQGVLVCNFPNPRTGNGLMEHKQVTTFFHEFGHLMHHILGGQGKWMRFSGVATEWDFVEAPSQMLEEWASDYGTLKRFATDARGRTIPEDLVRRLRKAREFGKALWVRHQMFYAATSLAFHRRDPEGLDPDKLIAQMQARYSPYPFVPGTHMQNSFGHLYGYSAIYYTYMWSLVIAKDMFSAFQKAGLLDHATAMRYRRTILGQGGNKDAAELVKDFLGRPYSFAAFERWLNRD